MLAKSTIDLIIMGALEVLVGEADEETGRTV